MTVHPSSRHIANLFTSLFRNNTSRLVPVVIIILTVELVNRKSKKGFGVIMYTHSFLFLNNSHYGPYPKILEQIQNILIVHSNTSI